MGHSSKAGENIFWAMNRNKPGIIKRILNALERFIARIRGKDAYLAVEQRQAAERLRDMLTGELKRAYGTDVKGEAAVESGEGKRHSLAGQYSQTAKLNSLSGAVRMNENGTPMDTIRARTGWWLGKDGKWRYEIDDSALSFDRNGYTDNAMYLADYVRHDKLFAAYPWLRGVKLKIVDVISGNENLNGLYNHHNDTIYLKDGRTDKQMKSTLLHELQHVIQEYEGFATGANPNAAAALLLNSAYNDLKRDSRFAKIKSPDEKMRIVKQYIERTTGNSFESQAQNYYYTNYGEQESRAVQERYAPTNDTGNDQIEVALYHNDGVIYDVSEEIDKAIDNLKEMGYNEKQVNSIIKRGIQNADLSGSGSESANSQNAWRRNNNGATEQSRGTGNEKRLGDGVRRRGDNQGTSETESSGRGVQRVLNEVSKPEKRFSLSSNVEQIIENDSGEFVAESNGNGGTRWSLSTYESSGRETLRQYLDGQVSESGLTEADAKAVLDSMDDIYEICRKYEGEYVPFGAWSRAEVVIDEKGNPVFSVVKPNGEYAMNLDFSLVCKKRRALDAVLNRLIETGAINDFGFGQEEIVRVNEIIREHGFEIACDMCFVDAKRYRQAGVADQFVDLYNSIVKSMAKDGQEIDYFNFANDSSLSHTEGGIDRLSDAELDFSEINEITKPGAKKTVEYRIAQYLKTHPSDRKLLSRGDFMSTAGFDAVKISKPGILKLYNSKKGTGGPKAAQSDVQYLNDILSSKKFNRGAAYDVGGVRVQSFSDYVPRLVFDYVQMIGDLAAKRLPAHAYTKEPLFAKQFGLTGMKINMSLMPAKGNGKYAGLNADGSYAWARESFPAEEAFRIQADPEYGKNVGTIAVGISDEHIWKMLSDPYIRMVIPYHKSGINPAVAVKLKIGEYTDYTGQQNTRRRDGRQLTKAELKNIPDINRLMHRDGLDAVEASRRYVEWCEDNGYIPKFEKFAYMTDSDGNRVFNENYYKLLEDFTTMVDGEFHPQGDVTATFPGSDSAFGSMADLIKEGLEEDAVTANRLNGEVDGLAEEVRSALGREESGKRFSLTRANDEYMKAVESGNVEEQQRLVDEAAAANGYSEEIWYHGTHSFGFTEFDLNRMDDGQSIFLTNNPLVAESYSGTSGTRPISEKLRWTNKGKADQEIVSKYNELFPHSERAKLATESDVENMRVRYNRDIEGDIEQLRILSQMYSTEGFKEYLKFSDEETAVLKKLADLYERSSEMSPNEVAEEYKSIIQDVKTGWNLNMFLPRGEGFANSARFLERLNNLSESGDALVKIGDYIHDIRYVKESIDEAIDNSTRENAGNYKVFARLGNVLEVDAAGYVFNNLPLPKELKKYAPADHGVEFTTREIAEYAKEAGYDSIVFDGIIDVGDNAYAYYESDVAVIFNPDDVKSADPITYDDSGNVIPLTERFDSGNRDIRWSLAGTNKDGIEVYETSDNIKNLTNKERMKRFEDIMKDVYRGRTAKFIRNGHAYYATFEDTDVKKNIYGDNQSSKAGWKAKIRAGADGDIFELVEDADYTGSGAEQGKSNPAHKGINLWDYYAKTVQIDNEVYDLVANVRRSGDDSYVYNIGLRQNKKIKASPPIGIQKNSVNTGAQRSDNRVSQNDSVVNTQYMREGEKDSSSERHSLVKSAQSELKALQKENEKLRQDVDDLKQELQLTHGRKLSRDALISSIQKILIDRYGVKLSAKELYPHVTNLYDMFYNNTVDGKRLKKDERVDTMRIIEEMDKIVDAVIENAIGVDDTYVEMKKLLPELRNTKLVVPMDARADAAQSAGFENWAEFRKANFGRVGFANEGLPVDTYYMELSERYPELFPDGITHPGEQAAHIADVVNTIRESGINEYQLYDIEDERIRTSIKNDVMDIIGNAEKLQTFADRAAQKVEDTKLAEAMHYGADIAKLKRLNAEKVADIKAENRKRLSDMRRKYQDRVESVRERYAEARANRSDKQKQTVLRNKVLRKYTEASSMLDRPTTENHFTEAMRKPLMEFLAAVDITTGKSVAKQGIYDRILRVIEAANKATAEGDENGLGIAETDLNVQEKQLIVDSGLLERMSAWVEANQGKKLTELSSAQLFDQIVSNEPPVGYVHLDFLQQPYFAADTVQISYEQHTEKNLRLDSRASVILAVIRLADSAGTSSSNTILSQA